LREFKHSARDTFFEGKVTQAWSVDRLGVDSVGGLGTAASMVAIASPKCVKHHFICTLKRSNCHEKECTTE